MKIRCMIRKYCIILTLTVSAVWFLPEAAFAKGANDSKIQ